MQGYGHLYEAPLRQIALWQSGGEYKITFTSEIYPQFAEKKSLRVTLEQLQKHDYGEELKSHDIYVVVAGRMVFLDAELIANLRKYSYLKKIRGVTREQLERLRKLISHRKKSEREG